LNPAFEVYLLKKHKEWLKENGRYGLHIHCPEAATPKDGPSAGTAITISILSLLLNIPINNKIAITFPQLHKFGGGEIFCEYTANFLAKFYRVDLYFYKVRGCIF
jgi:hypothetical protein